MTERYGNELIIPNIPPQPIIQCGVMNYGNPQTDHLLSALGLSHQWTVPCKGMETVFSMASKAMMNTTSATLYQETDNSVMQEHDPNEIDI
jgi:hypothetical protein